MDESGEGGLSEARARELAEKNEHIEAFIERHQLEGLLLNSHSNFAWATAGGSNWVGTDNERGVASLLYLASGQRYALANNLEIPRLENEERLSALGFELIGQNWWESPALKEKTIWDLVGGSSKKLGSDHPLVGAQLLNADLMRERFELTLDEAARYRQVGADATYALETVCASLSPGMSEWEIAGKLAQAVFEQGMLPFVTLVATDERIFNYRHPIPTHKKLEKYVEVVLCAKRGGLIANCTRLVHFGPLSDELKRKQEAVLHIDTTFNLNTRRGANVGEIFAKAQAAYAQTGFGEEWKLHHQGGATGYNGRDYWGLPDSEEIVQSRQAFAWNPSITGIKSEDTILVSPENGLEVLTRNPRSEWPTVKVEIDSLGELERPLVLEK